MKAVGFANEDSLIADNECGGEMSGSGGLGLRVTYSSLIDSCLAIDMLLNPGFHLSQASFSPIATPSWILSISQCILAFLSCQK